MSVKTKRITKMPEKKKNYQFSLEAKSIPLRKYRALNVGNVDALHV